MSTLQYKPRRKIANPRDKKFNKVWDELSKKQPDGVAMITTEELKGFAKSIYNRAWMDCLENFMEKGVIS